MRWGLPLHQAGKPLFCLILIMMVISSCGAPASTPTFRPSPVFVVPTPTAPATPVPTDVPAEIRLGDSVPPALRAQVAASVLPAGAKLTLDISNSESTSNQIQWVYVLVAPFPTVRDGVTADELHTVWSTGPSSELFNAQPILVDESTLAALTALFGQTYSKWWLLVFRSLLGKFIVGVRTLAWFEFAGSVLVSCLLCHD